MCLRSLAHAPLSLSLCVCVNVCEPPCSLYLEKIDVGESEPRQIISGLVKHVPLEEMLVSLFPELFVFLSLHFPMCGCVACSSMLCEQHNRVDLCSFCAICAQPSFAEWTALAWCCVRRRAMLSNLWIHQWTLWWERGCVCVLNVSATSVLLAQLSLHLDLCSEIQVTFEGFEDGQPADVMVRARLEAILGVG